MPYDTEKTDAGVYVINTDTGERKNQKPMSMAKAKKYMAALYAAESQKEFIPIGEAILDEVLEVFTPKHLGNKHNQKVHGSRYTQTAAQIRAEAKKRADSEWSENDSWRLGSKRTHEGTIRREMMGKRQKVEKPAKGAGGGKPSPKTEKTPLESNHADMQRFFEKGDIEKALGSDTVSADQVWGVHGEKFKPKARLEGFKSKEETKKSLDQMVENGQIRKVGDKYTANKPGFPQKDQAAKTLDDIKTMEAEKNSIKPYGDTASKWKELETKIDVAHSRLQGFKTGQNLMKQAMDQMKNYDFGNNFPILKLTRPEVPGGFLFFGKNGEVFLFSDIENMVGAGQPVAMMEAR